MKTKRGLLVAISSPSGGGKSTIIKRILAENKDKPYVYSISMTTRPKREGEIDGRDYWFVDEETFKEKIKSGDLIEYENVHGCFYGTPKTPIQNWIDRGKIVFLDIDVYGALSLRKSFPTHSLLIFLKPPDLEVLKKRLLGRATEDKSEIQKRLQRVPMEMAEMNKFDEIVVNDDLDGAVRQIEEIVNKK
ncbi:MAG: guanylate kinase [Calditrichaeota bacterium]|nr:guanylate kinase [Calditrichota bacterium]